MISKLKKNQLFYILKLIDGTLIYLGKNFKNNSEIMQQQYDYLIQNGN